MEIGHRFRDQCSHSDHRETTDDQVVADRAAGPNRRSLSNQSRQRMFVRFGSPKLLQVRRRRPREAIVRKDGSGTDHDAIFNGHRVTDIDLCIDLDAVALATEGFSGAEIASLVPDAMFAAFAEDERPIITDDLVASARNVVPLATTASERLAELRSWASTRARRASEPEARTEAKQRRTLDLA